MSVSTVTRVDAGGWRALCSCGWEGEDRHSQSAAYRDRGHHAKGCQRGATELLEDPDGAPYPNEVQAFVRRWTPADVGAGQFRGDLVAALESISQGVHE